MSCQPLAVSHPDHTFDMTAVGTYNSAVESDPSVATKAKQAMCHGARKRAVAVDLFCGAGGLTRGLLDAGVRVVAGYDTDEACRHAYEHNNPPAVFKCEDVRNLSEDELRDLYPAGVWRILVGCAPCQPFSKYARRTNATDYDKWGLLAHFARLTAACRPDIVSMENVPELQRHGVYVDFTASLHRQGYHTSPQVVFCPDYGVPQRRTRLVLLASRLGPIDLIDPTHDAASCPTVRQAIGGLPRLCSGGVCRRDPLHRSSRLAPENLRRIRASRAGGTWRDWPSALVAACHRRKKGKTYPSVYGRMSWDEPAPTITTQFHGFGNGRFGHPSQDRAISLREGATLQSFPQAYEFVEPGKSYYFSTVARMIGNAVPVRLGHAIGVSIVSHLRGVKDER